jgi:hypothetical protein
MNSFSNNQMQTSFNQVEGGSREVIQCLIDWLKQEPSDEKPHRLLRALANESIKKAGFEEHKRRFTADELVAATEEVPIPIDAKKWLDWTGSFADYWRTREPQVIKFAKQKGLHCYPKPERISTKGGPGNFATFCIKAIPIPEFSDDEIDCQSQQNRGAGQQQTYYETALLGEIKSSWLVRKLFRDGQIHLKRWHIGMILIGMSVATLIYVSWLALSIPQPITTRDITLFISIFGLPFFLWIMIIRPWAHLFNDRIVLAHNLLIQNKEKSAQVELLQDGELSLIRLVRYSAPCPICGSTVYLEDGSPNHPRRLVGRCHGSPKEHIFSFDRVTRKGRIL